jgi:CheY-like chemotaxis protein
MAAVLVVEDNEALRKLVVMLLEQKGYHVLSASNGLEGLMVYTSYRLRVDLVLTDIDMPQLDGIQLAARIRAQDPTRKIVFMSGRAAEDPGELANSPVLSKPFSPDKLYAMIEEVLKAQSEPVR